MSDKTRQGRLHLVSSQSKPVQSSIERVEAKPHEKLPPHLCAINAAMQELELLIQCRTEDERIRPLNRLAMACGILAASAWDPQQIEQIRTPLEAMIKQADRARAANKHQSFSSTPGSKSGAKLT